MADEKENTFNGWDREAQAWKDARSLARRKNPKACKVHSLKDFAAKDKALTIQEIPTRRPPSVYNRQNAYEKADFFKIQKVYSQARKDLEAKGYKIYN